jgi:hypothetical protein
MFILSIIYLFDYFIVYPFTILWNVATLLVFFFCCELCVLQVDLVHMKLALLLAHVSAGIVVWHVTMSEDGVYLACIGSKDGVYCRV